MQIRVEFYGVPRIRAECGEAVVALEAPATVERLLAAIASRFPAVAEECLVEAEGRLELAPAYTCNADGKRFVRDSSESLEGVRWVMLLAADAGG